MISLILRCKSDFLFNYVSTFLFIQVIEDQLNGKNAVYEGISSFPLGKEETLFVSSDFSGIKGWSLLQNKNPEVCKF